MCNVLLWLFTHPTAIWLAYGSVEMQFKDILRISTRVQPDWLEFLTEDRQLHEKGWGPPTLDCTRHQQTKSKKGKQKVCHLRSLSQKYSMYTCSKSYNVQNINDTNRYYSPWSAVKCFRAIFLRTNLLLQELFLGTNIPTQTLKPAVVFT